jgi:hypothetical protein
MAHNPQDHQEEAWLAPEGGVCVGGKLGASEGRADSLDFRSTGMRGERHSRVLGSGPGPPASCAGQTLGLQERKPTGHDEGKKIHSLSGHRAVSRTPRWYAARPWGKASQEQQGDSLSLFPCLLLTFLLPHLLVPVSPISFSGLPTCTTPGPAWTTTVLVWPGFCLPLSQLQGWHVVKWGSQV